MADYHVMGTDKAGNSMRVAFHIAIPATTNDAGKTYQDALVELLTGSIDGSSISSAVPDIDTAELTQMQNGEIFEKVVELDSNPAENYPTKQARLDAKYSEVAAEVAAELQTRLQYWGYQRNIP